MPTPPPVQPVQTSSQQPTREAPAPRAVAEEQPTSPVVQEWGAKWSFSHA